MKRVGFIGTAIVAAIVGASLHTSNAYAAANTCTWTGAAGDHKFSTASNWTNCSGSVPQSGDSLLFDQWVGPTMNGSSNMVWLTNDLPTGNTYAGLSSTANSSMGYTIDNIAVTGGATISKVGSMYMYIDNLTSAGAVTLDGVGVTNADVASVEISNNAALWNTNASIVVKSGSELIGQVSENSYSYSGAPSLTIENGAKLFLCGTQGNAVIGGNITFGGGTGATPEFRIEPCMGAAGAPVIPSSGVKITGTVTLLSDAIMTSTNKLLIMDGALVANGHQFTVNAGDTSKVMGKGTVGNIALGAGSVIAPGASPGCLTTGNISWVQGATYSFDLGGKTVCTEYDQIRVGGTVNLGNGTLSIVGYGGFAPAIGDSFTIIDNDSSDSVSGTFTGIAEGGLFTQNGVSYRITYTGGDGNDVVITVVSLPGVPNTGVEAMVRANPMLIAGITLAMLVAIVVAGRIATARR